MPSHPDIPDPAITDPAITELDITDLDITARRGDQHYNYTRVVGIAGRTVRARVHRDFYPQQSRAVVEVLADNMTWTHLTDDHHGTWVTTTPAPTEHLDPHPHLAGIADRLIRRAAVILAPPDQGGRHRPR